LKTKEQCRNVRVACAFSAVKNKTLKVVPIILSQRTAVQFSVPAGHGSLIFVLRATTLTWKKVGDAKQGKKRVVSKNILYDDSLSAAGIVVVAVVLLQYSIVV
jgi:hypothetical protein